MTVKRLLNDQLALPLLKWKTLVMLKVIFEYWNYLFSIKVEFIENQASDFLSSCDDFKY